MHRIILLLWCAAFAAGESNLGIPLVGMARDARRQIRPVCGVTGNFMLRDSIPEAAFDWAFDGSGGLIRTGAELLTLDPAGKVTGRYAAPRGDAVLSAGAAFFGGISELWLIGARPDRKIRIEPDALGGAVVALGAPNGRSTPLAVCREKRLWLVTVDVTGGMVTRETLAPGAIGDRGCTGALVWLDGSFLLATGRDLIFQTAAGDEHHLPVTVGARGATPEIHRAGDHWVQVEAPGVSPALLLVTSDGVKAYRLPATRESR